MASVYLIHFEQPYKHARHYLGFSEDVPGRIRAHRRGKGARLISVVNDAGIDWAVVRIWRNMTRADERKLKHRRDAPGLCPVCRGEESYDELRSREAEITADHT